MWLVVINPQAGKGKASSLSNKLQLLLQINHVPFGIIHQTSKELTTLELRSKIESGKFHTVIAIGGDGLVNLCLQEIAEREIALAVIPAGTGNDFARAVGSHKKSVDTIVHTLLDTKPFEIDLGLVTGGFGRRWYVQVLSTGFDALVNGLANKITWPKGQLRYSIATLYTLAQFKPIEYEVIVDGKQIKQDFMLVVVANGKTYGGGMQICPNASISDGLFDILLVHPVSKLVLLTIFPKVFFGKHIPHPKIEVLYGRRVQLSAKAQSFADGEFISKLPIRIENVPNALKTWLMK
jgi:diacylglycerol kinase (ATP)